MGWIYLEGNGGGALSAKHGPGKMCDTYFSSFSAEQQVHLLGLMYYQQAAAVI